MSDHPIRIILDTSAIIAYTQWSIHVGGVLAEVTDEGGEAGLPVLCLLEAGSAAVDLDRLDLLVEHPCTVVLPVLEDWRSLRAMRDVVGRTDAATAAVWAYDLEAYLLTATPSWYAGWGGGASVIPI